MIKNDVERLITFLEKYEKEYKSLDDEKQKEYYYELRDNFNHRRFDIDYSHYSENWISRAAQIIFLNRTCFNGLFRFNSKGEFNTPRGRYKNPKILDRENLLKVRGVLQNVDIKRADYKTVKEDIKESSFVYFDPPYRPISDTSSFTAYSKYGFSDEDQKELAKLFKELDVMGVKIMLSNSDPKNTDPDDNFFDELYNGYFITRIPAKRVINSDAKKRGEIHEIVITNYEVW